MSWLAKSFANLIVADEEDEGRYGDDRRGDGGKATSGEAAALSSPANESNGEDDGFGDVNLGKGVKEDLTELSKTLTRQFWGVASFLAPPPAASPQTSSLSSADADLNSVDRDADSDPHPPTVSPDSADPDQIDYSPRIGGIRHDFAEIGGRFRSGISKLSSAKAVSEISKIASSFLQLGSDEEGEEVDEEQELRNKLDSGGIDAIGVTEEVLAFAQNISMHPETWLDFPLFSDDEATDDFDMSDAQQEHALAVEHLVPRLAALRIELCPGHISEGNFWKIYFVLLHPRLNKHDAELLSTPQIVEARALLLQDLQSRTKSAPNDWPSSTNKKEETSSVDESSTNPETNKHSVATLELRIVDKAVIEEDVLVHIHQDASPEKEVSATVVAPEKLEDNGDEWLEDESTAAVGGKKISAMAIADDEDVSFSDLEEDDETLQDGGGARALPASSAAGKPVAGKLPEEANEWSDLDDLVVA